jgi:hypothetical protein
MPFSVKPETEAVFLRKLSDLYLTFGIVRRPEANQVNFVDGTMLFPAHPQLAFDRAGERFHRLFARRRQLIIRWPFCQRWKL